MFFDACIIYTLWFVAQKRALPNCSYILFQEENSKSFANIIYKEIFNICCVIAIKIADCCNNFAINQL